MGELFRQTQPSAPFAWTGERMVTDQTGAIEAEHYHRYFLARELCRGKDVLDVASGEGYGSALLSQTAKSVVGVEIDPKCVEHAAHEYRAANLRYLTGDTVKLPLRDKSVDAVVSFETIEHISDQGAFLSEVKRVLRPSGLLLVSTPDLNVYSAPGTEANPYHVRELTELEFRQTLKSEFNNVLIVRQRAVTGSLVLPDSGTRQSEDVLVFEQRDSTAFEVDRKLLRAPFLLAIASEGELPDLPVSAYIQTVNVTHVAQETKAELARLLALEADLRDKLPVYNRAMSDAAELPVLQTEIERLRKVEDLAREQGPQLAKAHADLASIPAINVELARLRQVEILAQVTTAELARLRSLEADLREKLPVYNKALNDAAELPALLAEIERLRQAETTAREQSAVALQELRGSVESLTRELQQTGQELTVLRQENALLSEDRDRAREETSGAESRLEAVGLLARQQAIALQRSLLQMQAVQREFETYKALQRELETKAVQQELETYKAVQQELETYKAEYLKASNLVIPLRLRRALPAPLKSALRAAKRALMRLTGQVL
jgi:ubiquinone/menaquinone biosynthesis C-methylase UbiE